MAYGRPANVRSHRRGNRRLQRRRAAPWISVTLVSVLVAVGLGVGFQQLLAQTCSGQQTARVLAAGETATLLDELATEWAQREPATDDGACAQVVVRSRSSAAAAEDLATVDDRAAGGDQERRDLPDVWVPTATAWVHRAASAPAAAAVLPDTRPSVARTPVVLAVPTPMAEELGWADADAPQTGADGGDGEADGGARPHWRDVLSTFADEDGWAAHGRDEWGPYRVGFGDPVRDTAGLLTLSALLDPDRSGAPDDDDYERMVDLQALVSDELYRDSTDQLMTEVRTLARDTAEAARDAGADEDEARAEAATQVLAHVSAFPALARQVHDYNQEEPAVPLTAVHPAGGTVAADHPYLVLDGDWVDGPSREVAEMFRGYLGSAGAQQQMRDAGYQPGDLGDGDASAPQVASDGSATPATHPPGADGVPPLHDPQAVTRALERWTALTRPSQVLLALDVSAAMAAPLPGGEQRRIDAVGDATLDTLSLFTEDDRVGLWGFATDLDEELDHVSLVPIGALGDVMEDDRTRRAHLTETVSLLEPGGGTGLYSTVRAAYDTMLDTYDPEARNLVVVVTSGVDAPEGEPSLTLDELRTHLEQEPADDQQVPVRIVSVGDQADTAALQQIAEATGGATHHVDDGQDLTESLRTAVFGLR